MLLTSRHSRTSIYDFKVWLLATSRLWPSLRGLEGIAQTGTEFSYQI